MPRRGCADLDRPQPLSMDHQQPTSESRANPLRIHTLHSRFQAGETQVRVLPPDSGRFVSTLYLLPVEPHQGRRG